MTADRLRDLFAPAAPGSLMRSILVEGPGRFRIARRNCEIYSVQIPTCGDLAKFRLLDACGETKFFMPTVFTGSFWLSAGCDGGLIAELDALNVVTIVINYREPDQKLV